MNFDLQNSTYLQYWQAVMANEKPIVYHWENETIMREKTVCKCNQIYEFSCKLHWTQWAEERFKELEKVIYPNLYWYVAVLKYPGIYDPTTISNFYLKYTSSLSRKFGYSHFVWVNHLKEVYLHRHYLLGYNQPIDTNWAFNKYRKMVDKYCISPIAEKEPYFQEAMTPKGWLRYALGIDYKRNPGRLRPWADEESGACLWPNVCDGSAIYNHNMAIKRSTMHHTGMQS